jgi:histidinol-phosphate aminotransferase
MEEISRLARPDVYAMKPYSSARTEGSQHARIYLDANENPYPPYPATAHEVGYNRYPRPQPPELIGRFAQLYGVTEDRLFLSRGADEAIDLLVRAFCAAGQDGILITPPSFVMYETAAQIQGAAVHRVPLLGVESGDVRLDVEGMLAAQGQNPGVKLVFVCSPNNPLGMLADRADVLRLADELFGRALVVVDELYVDYSGRPSLGRDVAGHPNLVALRSVSKEYSLAGERCGITVADPEVVRILTRVMAPYSLSVSSVRAVANAVSEEGIAHGRRNIAAIVAERERVRAELSSSPLVVGVHPSDANFLLVRVRDAGLLVKTLEEAGIKIRDRSGVIEGGVRISIGTPAENDELLRVLGAL